MTFTPSHASALSFNVHPAVLALDGACSFQGESPRFRRAGPPSASGLARLLDTLIARALVGSGAPVAQEDDHEEHVWLDPDADADAENALAQLQGASSRYPTAGAPVAGRKILRLHSPRAGLEGRATAKSSTADGAGCSLDAGGTRGAWGAPADMHQSQIPRDGWPCSAPLS